MADSCCQITSLSVRKTIENETKKLDTDEYFQPGSTPNESMELRRRQRLRQESASWRLQRLLRLTKRRLQMEMLCTITTPRLKSKKVATIVVTRVASLASDKDSFHSFDVLFSPEKTKKNKYRFYFPPAITRLRTSTDQSGRGQVIHLRNRNFRDQPRS